MIHDMHPTMPAPGSTWESTTTNDRVSGGPGTDGAVFGPPQPIWRVRVLEVLPNDMIRAQIISTNFATGLQTPPGTEIRNSVKTLRVYGRPYVETVPPAASP